MPDEICEYDFIDGYWVSGCNPDCEWVKDPEGPRRRGLTHCPWCGCKIGFAEGTEVDGGVEGDE